MCGFIGWFQNGGGLDDGRRQRLSQALNLITHRGPDDGSEAEGPGWYMGFRRLSIQDLSPAGRQPMRFAGDRCTLTFNGEIYNFRELRASLTDATFHSTGDTEVLGRMLERAPEPEEVLRRLRGMFAFAWWDEGARTLLAARDPFGIKPLYYRLFPDGSLMIGSEIKALRKMMGPDTAISQAGLAEYFRWGAVQAPHTIYEGVQCLPPGHLLRWSEGDLQVERYFVPEWPGKAERVGGKAALELTREVVSQSVKAHLVSDVPVGVFLSGGLDSTLMVALMKHHGLSDIQAFSIGYEENAGVPDESDAAEKTAKFYGCRFVRERLTSASLFARLDDYLACLDQPTGDALNTWLVSQVAARHVKVTLSGLGADEWFGGYNYHRLLHLARLLPVGRTPLRLLTAPLAGVLNGLLPAGAQGHKAWKALYYASGAAGRSLPEMHAHARSIFSPRETARLLGCRTSVAKHLAMDNEIRDVLVADLDQRAPDSWLHQLLLMETETYLPNTLLRDNDVTSMAHSLELRVPLVDPEVFTLAGRLRPSSKLNLRGGKRNLRAAFHDILPEWIAQDTRKKTFTLPLMKWMRDEAWKERISDTLHSHKCRERGLMNPKVVLKHLDAYYRTDVSDKRAWRLSQSVWLMFVLESWVARQAERFQE